MGGTDLDGQYVPLIERGTGGEFVSKYIGSGNNARERILTRGGNILPNTPEAATPPTIVEAEPVQRAGGGFYQNPQYQEARPQQFKKEITPAMRGETGNRTVNISENIRHLSDPTWLASQGYNLNKVSPQQLVGEYLQRLQSKTGNADLQDYIQTTRKRFK
jgi:hypothetical protein